MNFKKCCFPDGSCFFIIWAQKQEVGWSDLHCCVAPSISPSSPFCFHCLFLLLALSAHRQLPSTPPTLCTGIHAYEHTNTDTHTHTQSLPAAIVTELTVLLSIWAATVTAAAFCERRMCAWGCVHEFSPITSWLERGRTVWARCPFIYLDLWLLWVERCKHGGHVLQGLVKSRGQAGLDPAGGSSGEWSRCHQISFYCCIVKFKYLWSACFYMFICFDDSLASCFA